MDQYKIPRDLCGVWEKFPSNCWARARWKWIRTSYMDLNTLGLGVKAQAHKGTGVHVQHQLGIQLLGCIGQMHSVLYSVHTLGVHVPMQGAWLELLPRTYILGAWAWAPYPSPCSLNFFRAFSSLKWFLWVYFGGFFKSILFGSISSLSSLYDINP